MNWDIKLFLLSAVMQLVLSKVFSLPYKPDSGGQCKSNTTEYINKEVKLCCSRCAPGTYLETQCTETSDTQCNPCASGYFNDKYNYFNKCFKCQRCREDDGLHIAQACTASSNTLCECRNGMFCRSGTSPPCKMCARFTSCPPGLGVTAPGTAYTDVSCAPCSEGSFSDQTSYDQTCQRHTNCSSEGQSFLHHGNSTSDAVCGPLVKATAPSAGTPSAPPPSFPPPLPAPSTPPAPPTRATPGQGSSAPPPQTPLSSGSYVIWAVVGVGLTLLVVGIVCIVCRRKAEGANENIEANEGANGTLAVYQQNASNCREQQGLLGKTDPSNPAFSASPCHTETHNSSSQERLLTDNPQVNVNITATFNCHLNQTTLPLEPTPTPPLPTPTPPPPPESDLPLSEEEEAQRSTPQQEEGKEARVAVQESDSV
ncbi:tumor necrosis factor receptor superfamily member 1B [Megalops cyprinoides]|uniref:tumor necrosis factor receptor superfamily member 1B n=1 Tax=Megalops cyprinoides TaxID=118141 RepID=UPI0018644186|nr:tumor necrosis factor receptor superfamily member 1B [Megalops cyprinoides]